MITTECSLREERSGRSLRSRHGFTETGAPRCLPGIGGEFLFFVTHGFSFNALAPFRDTSLDAGPFAGTCALLFHRCNGYIRVS